MNPPKTRKLVLSRTTLRRLTEDRLRSVRGAFITGVVCNTDPSVCGGTVCGTGTCTADDRCGTADSCDSCGC